MVAPLAHYDALRALRKAAEELRAALEQSRLSLKLVAAYGGSASPLYVQRKARLTAQVQALACVENAARHLGVNPADWDRVDRTAKDRQNRAIDQPTRS